MRKEPFPRTFYVANTIELFERMAFYGMYIGLSLYLTKVIHFDDLATGAVLGNFRFVSALAPIACGAVADRVTFKRSLAIAFSLYAFGYLALFFFPSKGLALVSLAFIGVAGGFMKPVILGTVARTAPPGREPEGYAVFYRMVNGGSVVGKTLAYLVRAKIGLAFVMLNSVVQSLVALTLALFAYQEPERGRQASAVPLGETLRGFAAAFKNRRFVAFLVIFAGYYFMIEQYYFTFPKYVTRHIDEKAPLEILTLVNPGCIALFQGLVTRATRRLAPLTSMVVAMLTASTAMFVMGSVPTLVGACLSGAIFAFAEMIFSPRFYAYIASFAPEGKAGLYMGLASVPVALGAWTGGYASGALVSRYLPEHGPRDPFMVWSTYAALGIVCMVAMLVYRAREAVLRTEK